MTAADQPHEGDQPAQPVDAATASGAPAPEAGGPAPDAAGDAEATGEGGAEAQLIALRVELAERTADAQRATAEIANYRRRVERDRELVKQNAVYSVLGSLMPVLDDVDRAREAGEVEGGFKAVADSLERAVAGLGLTKFGTTGDEFDPNLHEALMHGHSPEVTTTTVDKVVQAGYRMGERVVRAAKVTVLDPEG